MHKYRVSRYRVTRSPAKRQYRKRKAGVRRTISGIALIFVLAGLALLAYVFLNDGSSIEKAVEVATDDSQESAIAPTDTTFKLTVPKMSRVEDLPVYSRSWDDETALEVGALHPEDTGLPWQDGSNVYIAGHRMGFPGTRSFLVFYDLDKVANGDEVILTDAQGTKYTYTVFNEQVLDPYDYYTATGPVPGKNIVTLQTCTLPDYTQRIIVQAELTNTEENNSSSDGKDVPLEAA